MSSTTISTESTSSRSPTKKVLPVKGQRNVLITSALPYVNNVPHLGNIIGAVLSADVYARYCRQRGYNTLYICGTDEYGTATETKAMEEGVTEQAICAKYHKIHAEVYEWFDIKFDIFGRTTTEEQTKIAQDIFMKLYNNNLLLEDTQQQLYDPIKQRYLADRFVYGTCPFCHYLDARGDQCDLCGKLLNPMDLINPKSKFSNVTPEQKTTQHLFLDLPKLTKDLEVWTKKATTEGYWTGVAVSITESWLKDGLKPRCITRDLKWGTPVPLEKYKDKVFYVWFDAPIGYISITANYTPDWEKWWKNPEDVQLYQFMGKDNVPFHSIIFPASLIGTGEKWTLVNSLSSTEYLNYENALKFSKTRGTGVFGDQAKSTGIPAEVWRYYLLTNRPEQADTEFSWDDFVLKNNNELLANLGNFINRALKFVQNNFASTVPARVESKIGAREKELIAAVNKEITTYIEMLEKVKIKEGLHTCMTISGLGNKYLQDTKPWELVNSDKELCATVVNLATQIVFAISVLIEPYMPSLTAKVLKQLNYTTTESEHKIHNSLQLDAIPAGHTIGAAEPLFAKFDEKQKKDWKQRFGGKEKFRFDLKVGKILAVDDITGKDKLYKMQVQVGPKAEMKRQIVGGLKSAYPEKEKLIGKQVIVVCNLKHKKMGAEKSEGMLLCAKAGDDLGLLHPTKDVEPGTQIIPEGSELEGVFTVMGPKETETILKELKTGDGGEALFKKYPFRAVAGENKVPVIADKGIGKDAPIA